MATLTKDLPPLPPDTTTPEPTQEDPHKAHTGVFRRLTSKLRSPSQQWAHGSSPHGGTPDLECVQEDPPSSPKKDKHKRKVSGPLLGLPAPVAVHRKPGIELENAFTSAEQRQAALRAVGLVPANARPGRDAHGYKAPLSEQEAQLDKYFATTPAASGEHESEAQKIKEAWLRKNNEAGVDEGGSVSGTRGTSRSPERRLLWRRSPEPKFEPGVTVAEEPKQMEKTEMPPMTADQVRARRKDDPVFAPSGLLAAMQAYRPENYRPRQGGKPSMGNASSMSQQRRIDSDSDTDSEA
ncbi:hypothetical protein BDY19DRAFT_907994 [Irpex rosettiformis]|uniref:Uncharacterized protein n=1 Tax=Irpex rosettiformis TaxID=378272 RepID=A0ACB8TXK8_9APHY|nr:hypothetical protein BDY19DRAFT_907994 [Irpex rosettiformis]